MSVAPHKQPPHYVYASSNPLSAGATPAARRFQEQRLKLIKADFANLDDELQKFNVDAATAAYYEKRGSQPSQDV